MEIKTTRTCARCARVYTPTGMSQKYCPKCGGIVKNEQIIAIQRISANNHKI